MATNRVSYGYGSSMVCYRRSTGKVKICSEYKTVQDAFPTAPNKVDKRKYNNLIAGIYGLGIGQMLDCLYITAVHAADSSLLNWINPGTHDLTVVNLAAEQFTIDRGWTGNGVNGYLNTNYNPNTDGINYALNDASIGVYSRTNVAEEATDIGACDLNLTNASKIVIRWDNNKLYYNINFITSGQIENLDSKGFYVASRLIAASQQLYKNKTQISESFYVPLGITSHNFYILAYNNNGVVETFTTRQISAAFAGGGMTQTNVNDFTDRIETFMDAIGAGVIS